MNIELHVKHDTVTRELRNLVNNEIRYKFEGYFDNIHNIHVTIEKHNYNYSLSTVVTSDYGVVKLEKHVDDVYYDAHSYFKRLRNLFMRKMNKQHDFDRESIPEFEKRLELDYIDELGNINTLI